ncbi:hypothetical protein KAR91_69110 [Candidatus Pacearchaeota archaeon]|nr:hypothetical protein [Candidatus Pacearchaeota archaeon]
MRSNGIGMVGLNGKTRKQSFDPENFNLAMSEEVSDALSEKCARVKELEEYSTNLYREYKREVNELKDMVQKIGEDNLRLKNLLKEHQIEY